VAGGASRANMTPKLENTVKRHQRIIEDFAQFRKTLRIGASIDMIVERTGYSFRYISRILIERSLLK
jgi:hypothetical protein